MTDNAKIIKNDVLTENPGTLGGGIAVYSYAGVGEALAIGGGPPSSVWSMTTAYNLIGPELNNQHIAETYTSGDLIGYYSWLFKGGYFSADVEDINFTFLDNIVIGDGLTPGNYVFKWLGQSGTTNTISSWVEGATTEEVTITTTSVHGFSVGDYVSFSDTYITAATSGIIYFNGLFAPAMPIRIEAVPSTTELTIGHNHVQITGDSVGAPESVTITLWDTLSSTPLTGESRQFIDHGSPITPEFFIMEYDVDSAEDGQISFGRLMAGDWFQPANNCQHSPFYPINKAELLEVSDGSYRSDSWPARLKTELSWAGLTQFEWLILRDLLKTRGIIMDVIYSAFPSDTSKGTTLNGALSGAAVTAVVVDDIPSDTPQTGTIRILRASGDYTRHTYTSWTTLTYTIASTDFSGNNAADGAAVYQTDWEDAHVLHGRMINWNQDHFIQSGGDGEWYSSVTIEIEGEVI